MMVDDLTFVFLTQCAEERIILAVRIEADEPRLVLFYAGGEVDLTAGRHGELLIHIGRCETNNCWMEIRISIRWRYKIQIKVGHN